MLIFIFYSSDAPQTAALLKVPKLVCNFLVKGVVNFLELVVY